MTMQERDAGEVGLDETAVRRIVIPTGDVMRLALQGFVAMLVIGLLLGLLKLLLVVATGRTLIELVFGR